MLHRLFNIKDLGNIWTSDKKCLRVLPPTPRFLNMTSTDLQSVHLLPDVGHYTEEKPLLAQTVNKTLKLETLTQISDAFRKRS